MIEFIGKRTTTSNPSKGQKMTTFVTTMSVRRFPEDYVYTF